MKRKLIKIDEELCDGCGNCVTECSEGALQIIGGKAKLVRDQYCDGFGDCIGSCPTGALTYEIREADEYNEEATKSYLLQTQGMEAVSRMEVAQSRHQVQHKAPPVTMSGGCPGSRMQELKQTEVESSNTSINSGDHPQIMLSELRQWPIQLHLVPPGAPFFRNKELVIMNPCGPLASADVHWRYLRGRSIVLACPKLDDTSNYAGKLGEILKERSIPKVIVVRMEVPCCGGLTMITGEAIKLSGRDDLIFQEEVLTLDGKIKRSQVVNT